MEGDSFKNSWIKKVESDRSWKSDAPIKGNVIWMHSASLGEFEMGRPVLEKFLDQHSDWNAVVTFLVLPGYERRMELLSGQSSLFTGRHKFRG